MPRSSLARASAVLLLALLAAAPALAHPGADETLPALDRRIEHAPHDATLYRARADEHRRAGAFEAARRDVAAARAIDPALPGVPLLAAAIEFDAGNTAATIKLLDAHLAGVPGDGDALLLRARSHARVLAHARAAEDYDAAIDRLHAPTADHYLERCAQWLACGDTTRALAGLAEARARSGVILAVERTALGLEVRSGRFDAALERLDAAGDALSRTPLWLEWRGDVLRAAGREIEALAAYTEALESLEALPAERRSTAAVRALEGRLQFALAATERAR